MGEVASENEFPELENDRYRIVKQIGIGAVATVWKAEDRVLNTCVAIKMMNKTAFKLETVQRLAQEVSIMSELDHPCIVKIYHTGVCAAGTPYVVMEFIEGKTLREHFLAIKEERGHLRLSIEETVPIIEQVAGALSAAHKADIVHRDLKPENIILEEDGSVKVVDFGMAKVLREGSPELTNGIKIFGTPQYMSCERAKGKPVNAAADVYALGIIAFEMLAGFRPFEGKGAMEILLAHVKEPPPPLPSVHEKVQKVIIRALDKEPKKRPSAGEFAHALKEAATCCS